MKILNTLYVTLLALFNKLENFLEAHLPFWNSLKANIKGNWQYVICNVVILATSTTSEITDIVLAWMPLIIVFAMLGMILGLLKKFGKF